MRGDGECLREDQEAEMTETRMRSVSSGRGDDSPGGRLKPPGADILTWIIFFPPNT